MVFKQFSESFVFALGALGGNKLRSSLSLLGIVIGIFLIIFALSAADGMKKSIEDSFSELGSDVVFISKWPWENMGPDYPWWKYLSRPNPNNDDYESIKGRSRTIQEIAFRSQTRTTVKARKEYMNNTEVFGISKEFKEVWNFPVNEGRYFSESESRMGFPVAILGADIAKDLFPNERALGKEITLKGKKLTVIGILKKEGKGLFGGFNDDAVFVPLQFYKSVVNLNNRDLFTEILVKAKPGYSLQALKDELTGIIRGSRRLKPIEENNFSLNEVTVISKQMEGIYFILTAVGWLIGIYAIFIGGFGVAQIMFVSVKERTAIIGIQKALGAKRSFILYQFLLESIMLCMVGCVIGLLLVYIGTNLITNLFDFPMALTMKNTLIGTVISIITGLASGIIPAYIGSRLDPVEAMRSK